jgi:hypothetical protein
LKAARKSDFEKETGNANSTIGAEQAFVSSFPFDRKTNLHFCLFIYLLFIVAVAPISM